MKKFAIASLIALAATAASAVEVGVTATRDYAGTDRTGGGITVGQKFGAVGLTAGLERTTQGSEDQNRLSLTGSVDVARFERATFAVKGGVAHLDNQRSADGYALFVGGGVSVPVTKQVSLTADVVRQYGQDRVQAFDGNRVTVGVKYGF